MTQQPQRSPRMSRAARVFWKLFTIASLTYCGAMFANALS